MPSTDRRLADLVFVGPAMLRDFDLLGIHSVAQLARQNPEKLYEHFCLETGQPVDICCFDVFSAAVAQARNQRLRGKQPNWWHWSRRRKVRDGRK